MQLITMSARFNISYKKAEGTSRRRKLRSAPARQNDAAPKRQHHFLLLTKEFMRRFFQS
jgi:hypothetical protein